MPAWVCPACARGFGHTRQQHVCAPALSIDAYFAGREPFECAIFDAVQEHLAALGEVYVEAVGVGILFKRARTFVELRPMKGRLRLSFILDHAVEHPRIARRVPLSRGSTSAVLYVDLRTPAEVDDEVRAWLTESYLSSPLPGLSRPRRRR